MGLFDDFAHGAVDGAGGVGFVGIDVHSQGELGADADHHVAEDQGAAFHM